MYKNFLFAIGLLCSLSVVLKPAEMIFSVDATVAGDLTKKEVCITKYEHHAAILSEPTPVSFSARISNASGNHKIKTFERQLNNKFSIRGNFRIEFSVENYLFFVQSSPQYFSNLAELRRLNI